MNNPKLHIFILLMATVFLFLNMVNPVFFLFSAILALISLRHGIAEMRMTVSEYLSDSLEIGSYWFVLIAVVVFVLAPIIAVLTTGSATQLYPVGLTAEKLVSLLPSVLLRYLLISPSAFNGYNAYFLWRYGEKAKKRHDTSRLALSTGEIEAPEESEDKGSQLRLVQ